MLGLRDAGPLDSEILMDLNAIVLSGVCKLSVSSSCDKSERWPISSKFQLRVRLEE